jgi:hypothetical protein
MAIGMATAVSLLAGCSNNSSSGTNNPGSSQPSPQQQASHGPFFPECGGISDQTVGQLTQARGLVNAGRNSAGCQWERKTEELSRTSVDDINIDGHSGFIAVANDPTMGDNLCEVGIQFQDDFIEWSISYAEKPFPPPCDVAKELTRQSIANAK